MLEENSEHLFRNGAHPTPIDEYEFWKRRHSNLQNIYTQLTDQNRKLIMDILEKNDSVYSDPLKTIFRRTVSALLQAKYVKMHLKAFVQQLKVFHSTHFHQSKAAVEPILHCMCIMWRENCHYPSANWGLLFKMMINMMIGLSNRNLDVDSIFQSDTEDSRTKIHESIHIFDYFKYELSLSSFYLEMHSFVNHFQE